MSDAKKPYDGMGSWTPNGQAKFTGLDPWATYPARDQELIGAMREQLDAAMKTQIDEMAKQLFTVERVADLPGFLVTYPGKWVDPRSFWQRLRDAWQAARDGWRYGPEPERDDDY